MSRRLPNSRRPIDHGDPPRRGCAVLEGRASRGSSRDAPSSGRGRPSGPPSCWCCGTGPWWRWAPGMSTRSARVCLTFVRGSAVTTATRGPTRDRTGHFPYGYPGAFVMKDQSIMVSYCESSKAPNRVYVMGFRVNRPARGPGFLPIDPRFQEGAVTLPGPGGKTPEGLILGLRCCFGAPWKLFGPGLAPDFRRKPPPGRRAFGGFAGRFRGRTRRRETPGFGRRVPSRVNFPGKGRVLSSWGGKTNPPGGRSY
ncbi:MAG: hypothetical protein Ct9H300mP1_22730 [Planctomycetaceae bacterium]|nr:MAG: hypothetical protein Ct9H300mP1_22730 [Planctomycetaceae bacterium]